MKELEYNLQSRFQFLVEPLPCLPHKCACCGRSFSPDPNPDEKLQFLDWNLEIEFFGKVYLCTDCLREACNQMGYASPEQVTRLESELKASKNTATAYMKENQELRNALASLNSVFGSGPVTVESLESVLDKTLEEELGDDINANDITLRDSTGKEGSIKQTDESGSSDVSNNENDGDFTNLL